MSNLNNSVFIKVAARDRIRLESDHINQYDEAIQMLENMYGKLYDEFMNFMILGDHTCKCKCQQENNQRISTEEYLSLKDKL